MRSLINELKAESQRFSTSVSKVKELNNSSIHSIGVTDHENDAFASQTFEPGLELHTPKHFDISMESNQRREKTPVRAAVVFKSVIPRVPEPVIYIPPLPNTHDVKEREATFEEQRKPPSLESLERAREARQQYFDARRAARMAVVVEEVARKREEQDQAAPSPSVSRRMSVPVGLDTSLVISQDSTQKHVARLKAYRERRLQVESERTKTRFPYSGKPTKVSEFRLSTGERNEPSVRVKAFTAILDRR